MKFYVGQRVRIVCNGRYSGEETSIIEIRPAKNDDIARPGKFRAGEMICVLDILHYQVGRNISLPPSMLKPVYDGNEPVNWTDCIWQPTPIRAIA